MKLVVQLYHLVVQKNHQLLKPLMSGVKSVSRHEEASGVGGSFAGQGGLIARHNLAIRVSRTTCLQLVPICHKGGSTKTTGGPSQAV